MTDDTDIQRISLWESLSGEWIKLPCECMRECGPAAQTLGGILRQTKRETFASVGKFARLARMPARTVKEHLRTLTQHGWITHDGRQPTRSGRPRRTVTRRVTRKALTAAIADYGFLPWWAACGIQKVGRLRWSERALLSIVMARLCSLRGAVQQQDGDDTDPTSIENWGGSDRFRFSLDSLAWSTGLSRKPIVQAKRRLKQLGIIDWIGNSDEHNGNVTDILDPRWDFRVVISPAASEGMVHVGFQHG